jgi:hypothetical protein
VKFVSIGSGMSLTCFLFSLSSNGASTTIDKRVILFSFYLYALEF